MALWFYVQRVKEMYPAIRIVQPNRLYDATC